MSEGFKPTPHDAIKRTWAASVVVWSLQMTHGKVLMYFKYFGILLISFFGIIISCGSGLRGKGTVSGGRTAQPF